MEPILSLWGKLPKVVCVRSNAFDIPMHYCATYLNDLGYMFELPYVDTEAEAIHNWNVFRNKLEDKDGS